MYTRIINNLIKKIDTMFIGDNRYLSRDGHFNCTSAIKLLNRIWTHITATLNKVKCSRSLCSSVVALFAHFKKEIQIIIASRN